MKLWLLILRCKLFGGIVVATEDHDGEINYHIARGSVFGRLTCKRYGLTVVLLEDGRCKGPSFIERWRPVWPDTGKIIATAGRSKVTET